MDNLLVKGSPFLGAGSDYQGAKVVIIGAPMDFTVSYKPGARFGPQRIREVSEGLEEYSPYQDKDLVDYFYYDAGDLVLPLGNVPKSLNILEKVVGRVLSDGKLPLVLGGEHLITLAPVQQLAYRYPDLAVVQFDAHADLRSDYLGEGLSHATAMRRVTEVVGGKNLFQLGIRSGTAEEFAYGRLNTIFHPFEILAPLKHELERLKKHPLYITIDIDVVDPAFAPGTGTPEPGGCTSAELIQALLMLQGLNVVGLDIVEVCPVYDPSDCTASLAAKLAREAIMLWG